VLEGTDLRSRPLTERRKLLATLLKKSSIQYPLLRRATWHERRATPGSAAIPARRLDHQKTGVSLWGWSAQRRLSQCQTDQQQEFVIGGYTLPEGSRKYFGALPVGYNSPAGLLFAGRVGTGFSEKLLADLYAHLQNIKRATCPFVNLPEKRSGRWGQGITPAVWKRCKWVEPVLVAQIKFSEWTSDDQLRQPVFLGLRTDKQAKDVVRE